MHRAILQTGEFYHIYNRGVEKRNIFGCEDDYQRFLSMVKEYNNNLVKSQREYLKRLEIKGHWSDQEYSWSDQDMKPLVDIIAYCLNPNHYHLILQQKIDQGITSFMRKLGTGYAEYFNNKYHRSGHLFQGKFQAVHIKTIERLVWLSAYVNANSEIHKIAQAETYQWSSYTKYLNQSEPILCNGDIILDQFKNIEEYKKFVKMVIKDAQEFKKEEERKYLLEKF